MLFVIVMANSNFHAAYADATITRAQAIHLYVGDTLIVQSNRTSVQQVFVQGNFSAVNITKPAQYPTNTFQIQGLNPSTYSMKFIFDYASDYQVDVLIRPLVRTNTAVGANDTTYYLSAGSFELDLNATFDTRPDTRTTIITPAVSPWDSFAGWMGNFGQAFPLWVKILYLALGVQFFSVGGAWIRRESKKKLAAAQHFDLGDKAYLWVDVAYKFLVVSFVAIVAIMIGELLILFVLRFMFLASFDLLSLWDVFVIGFAAGAIIFVYLVRFTLEKAFDLKPLGDE